MLETVSCNRHVQIAMCLYAYRCFLSFLLVFSYLYKPDNVQFLRQLHADSREESPQESQDETDHPSNRHKDETDTTTKNDRDKKSSDKEPHVVLLAKPFIIASFCRHFLIPDNSHTPHDFVRSRSSCLTYSAMCVAENSH